MENSENYEVLINYMASFAEQTITDAAMQELYTHQVLFMSEEALVWISDRYKLNPQLPKRHEVEAFPCIVVSLHPSFHLRRHGRPESRGLSDPLQAMCSRDFKGIPVQGPTLKAPLL